VTTTPVIIRNSLYLDASEMRTMIGTDSGNPFWEISMLTVRKRKSALFIV
jgi:hypothetical protein